VSNFAVPKVVPAKADIVSLEPQSWYVLYSEGTPDHPVPTSAGAWSLTLPDAAGSVHYVQTPFRASVPATKVSITFRVNSSSDASYNGRVDPACVDPATFHLFLERRGDDLTNENYRWWSAEGGYILGSEDNTAVTLEVPLTSDKWTNVYGAHNEAEFNKTLSALGWVGITFGGRNYWGHGVNMNSGSAQLTLLDYHIE
jgi:hypothetical protein